MKLTAFAILPIILLWGLGTRVLINVSLINNATEKAEETKKEIYEKELNSETIVVDGIEYSSVAEYLNSVN